MEIKLENHIIITTKKADSPLPQILAKTINPRTCPAAYKTEVMETIASVPPKATTWKGNNRRANPIPSEAIRICKK